MEVYYDKQNKRLVYTGEAATPDFWDRMFDSENFKKNIERGKDDWFVLRTLKKYMPDKKGCILDGGCGGGRIVYCMHAHGYESVGVDSASKTIAKIKELFPELNVRAGDVCNLETPDDHFSAYWSIGVIEHFWDGYQPVIREMKRVLVNGGYLFLSFPYMSPLRKLKAKLGLYRKYSSERKKDFYQFALDHNTVVKDFEANGFKVVEKKPSAGVKGFKDEFSLLKPALQRLFGYKGGNILVRGVRYVLDQLFAFFAGHTIFIVLQNVKRVPLA